MSKWFLVRHGQTDWNAQGLLQGHTDVPLNDVGRDQARRLGESLSHVGLGASYSSDLLRCAQTLEPLVAGRDLSVSYTKLPQGAGLWPVGGDVVPVYQGL